MACSCKSYNATDRKVLKSIKPAKMFLKGLGTSEHENNKKLTLPQE